MISRLQCPMLVTPKKSLAHPRLQYDNTPLMPRLPVPLTTPPIGSNSQTTRSCTVGSRGTRSGRQGSPEPRDEKWPSYPYQPTTSRPPAPHRNANAAPDHHPHSDIGGFSISQELISTTSQGFNAFFRDFPQLQHAATRPVDPTRTTTSAVS